MTLQVEQAIKVLDFTISNDVYRIYFIHMKDEYYCKGCIHFHERGDNCSLVPVVPIVLPDRRVGDWCIRPINVDEVVADLVRYKVYIVMTGIFL